LLLGLPFSGVVGFDGGMAVASLPDAQLVARCRAGDDAAWCELVERFSRYVYSISVRAFKLQEADAEDVFQEVFARAYQHLGTLRDDEAIRAWIGQLTRRACIDRLRAASREQPVGEELEPPGAEDALAEIDEAVSVHEALLSLSESCKEILDRFFARDESYRTIADALALPPGTVASRISRCLGKLREHLEGRNSDATASRGG